RIEAAAYSPRFDALRYDLLPGREAFRSLDSLVSMLRSKSLASGLSLALCAIEASTVPAQETARHDFLPTSAELSKLPPDGGPEFNRLVFEKSPYLLQHARNPVRWFAWGPAAFSQALEQHKPIFLSIGYSTCHWCHVMEHESFEDAE